MSVRTFLAGVGYSNLSDLSVGPMIVAELMKETWPAHVEVDDLSYGPIAVMHRFAEASPPFGRLVVVSSVARDRQGPPIRSYRWDAAPTDAEEVQARVVECVTGVIDLENLLIVLRHFEVLPPEVFVVEVEPIAVEFGMEVSPAIAAHFPEIGRAHV